MSRSMEATPTFTGRGADIMPIAAIHRTPARSAHRSAMLPEPARRIDAGQAVQAVGTCRAVERITADDARQGRAPLLSEEAKINQLQLSWLSGRYGVLRRSSRAHRPRARSSLETTRRDVIPGVVEIAPCRHGRSCWRRAGCGICHRNIHPPLTNSPPTVERKTRKSALLIGCLGPRSPNHRARRLRHRHARTTTCPSCPNISSIARTCARSFS